MAVAELNAPSCASGLAPSVPFTPRHVGRNDWIAAFLLTAFDGVKTLEQRERATRELHRLVDQVAAQCRAGVSA